MQHPVFDSVRSLVQEQDAPTLIKLPVYNLAQKQHYKKNLSELYKIITNEAIDFNESHKTGNKKDDFTMDVKMVGRKGLNLINKPQINVPTLKRTVGKSVVPKHK